MKVWIKYLLGAFIGISVAFIFPSGNAGFVSVMSFLSELFIRTGRYIVIPLIFTTAIESVNKLRTSKLLLKTTELTFLIIVASTLILTFVGLISILIVKLPRIPITVDVAAEIKGINVKQLILSLFPYSGFAALLDGSFLLVSLVAAFLIGWESASEEIMFKPIFALADSASKLFYNIATFFTEIMSVFCIAIVCFWAVQFRGIIEMGIYTPMILLLFVDFLIVVGVIYPLILHFVCHDPHPYKVLYASIAPMVLSFFSGDANLALPLANRHCRESLGIRRRS